MGKNKFISYNEIPDMNEPWNYDARLNLRYSGESVEAFIKRMLNEKGAAMYYDPGTSTQYVFKSLEDRQAWIDEGMDVSSTYILTSCQFNFSGKVGQIEILHSYASTNLYFTTLQEKAELTVGFKSKSKGITDTSWTEVIEDFYVSVAVDKGTTGAYTAVETDTLVLNGNTITVDVKKYLASGSNRVRFSVRGATSGETSQLVFVANVTAMYLTPSNFAWWLPIIEGKESSIGGMNIGGNLSKKVKMRITNDTLGYDVTHETDIGMATYITNAFSFQNITFPTTGTGVYHVDIWVETTDISTDHLHYDMMFVAAADENTAQLACINEVNADAKNGMDSTLFKYAVYSLGAASADVTVNLAMGDDTFVTDSLSGVTAASAQTYTAALEIESEAVSFDLTASVAVGDSSQSVTIPVDNSMSFPAVAGATFYLNPSTRNNAQADRASIKNEVDGTLISTTSNNMAWVDGVDGWTEDADGRPCLKLEAGTHMTPALTPMANVGNGWTFECAYMVKNAVDSYEPVLSIMNDVTSANFIGLRVTPLDVCLHSRDLNTNDLAQSYSTGDEKMIHLVVTITKNYNTNYGHLAQIYVNGVMQKAFSFTSTDSFITSANLILGSDSADLYIYKMRVYNQSFGWPDAAQNFFNCLPTHESKLAAWTEFNSMLDDSYNMDYDKCVASGYNTMVIEMLDGASFPDKLHPAGGYCNVTINIHNIPDGEIDDEMRQLLTGYLILSQFVEGQGTTSMTYLKWNLRWKLTKLILLKRRITAKKNVASSTHAHKMGATRWYNMVWQRVCGPNEAGGRVTVAQYPVYAFLKQLVDGTTDQYVYIFVGLYTVGADKGDKFTFGFDNEEFAASIMHLEGTDHTPMMVGFDYPYEECSYSAGKEAIGAVTASGDVAAAWEVGAAGELEPDSTSDQAAVKTMLDAEWMPAYNVVEHNRTTILGVSDTLEEINANPTTWRNQTTAEGKPYSELDFWTDGVYDIMYYNVKEGVYKTRGINLLTQLGLTADDVSGMDLASKNELFKAKRRDIFRTEFPKYFDLDDALFHEVGLEIICASDNFKKNKYPYKFKLLADGGLWRNRQDDLDSIFGTNNQGFWAKLYSLLLGDKSTSGSIFRGENSNFTILLEECFKEEKKAMARRIFDAMVEISPYGQSQIERLVGCIQYCFFDFAQGYFTKSAYNLDAIWTYIEAWPLWNTKVYENDVDPLQQIQGNSAEAELAWVTLRMIFYASMVNWGPFATDNGDDTSLGQVSFRAAGGKTFSITPAIAMNPTILIGQSDMVSAGRRVMEGETVEVTVPDMGNNDTHVYIQATDYIEDLGDLCDLQVSADNPVLSVGAKRMRRLKVGDVDASRVTSNVQRMVMGSCPCMEEVDARNLASLTGTVDLTQLPRLRSALFAGTSAANVVIASGSKVTALSLPSTVTTLSLMNLPFLTASGLTYSDLSNLSYLRVEGNANLSALELLRAGMAGGALAAVRVLGISGEGTAEDINLLAALADAGANGITATGEVDSSSGPIVEGELTIMTSVSASALEKVQAAFPNLNVVVMGSMYIEFEDAEAERICAEKWGDGTGITYEQAAAVINVGRAFYQNTLIKSFDEFQYFTGLTSWSNVGVFQGCTALERITFPPNVSGVASALCAGCTALTRVEFIGDVENIAGYWFQNCTSLVDIIIDWSKIKNIATYAFQNCKALIVEDLSLPSLETIGGSNFNGSPIRRVLSLGTITTLSSDCFQGCSELVYVKLPDTLDTIGGNALRSCAKLASIVIPNITTIGAYAFRSTPLVWCEVNADAPPTINSSSWVISNPKIYVPDASVEAYKTATGWTSHASKIYPKSERTEVEEYAPENE